MRRDRGKEYILTVPIRIRVVLFCLLAGLPSAVGALGGGPLAPWWISGIVLAASFVPIALFGPRRFLALFGVIASVLLVVTVFCTWTEGLVFMESPQMRERLAQGLMGIASVYTVTAVVLAVLAWALRLHRAEGPIVLAQSPPRIALAMVASGIIYAAFYLVTGYVTFRFFTHGYYPHAEEMVARIGVWFWPMQIGRGALMATAALPAILTLRMSRAQTAVVIGLLLWVAGGVAPLLLPNPAMVAVQRYIHIVEILGQNLPLGVAVALLVRKRAPARTTIAAGVP